MTRTRNELFVQSDCREQHLSHKQRMSTLTLRITSHTGCTCVCVVPEIGISSEDRPACRPSAHSYFPFMKQALSRHLTSTV